MAYSVLRYLESHDAKYLYYLIAVIALHFTTKETAYIYSAQLLLFAALLTIFAFIKRSFPMPPDFLRILIKNMIVLGFIVACTVAAVWVLKQNYGLFIADGSTSLLLNQEGQMGLSLLSVIPLLRPFLIPIILLIIAVVTLLASNKILCWEVFRAIPAFDILILTGFLVLPLLPVFLVSFAGVDPLAYTETFSILTNYIFLVYSFSIAAVIGWLWDRQSWWKYALLFFSIYFVFFTTFFTNGLGFLTGVIGSLGHWLAQQDFARGGQPWYYFALLQIPVYEYLAAFGFLSAVGYALANRQFCRSIHNQQSRKIKKIRGLISIRHPSRSCSSLPLGFYQLDRLYHRG